MFKKKSTAFLLLREKPIIVTVTELLEWNQQKTGKKFFSPPPCGVVMSIAAKYAEEKKINLIRFEHSNPPRFYGTQTVLGLVTIANKEKFKIPESIKHLAISGSDRYIKLTPNYYDFLSANKKRAA